MKVIATAVLATLALSIACAEGQSVTVNAKAVVVWTDTHVSVTNGECITINANGNWNPEGTGVNGISDTVNGTGLVPDGVLNTEPDESDFFLANNIWGGLVAYIGDNPFQTNGVEPYTEFGSLLVSFPETNGYWTIGSSGQFIATTNGELWVGMNDDASSHGFGDNHGSVNAQVFQGYFATNSNWSSTRPSVSFGFMSGSNYSFNISSTNCPNSFWAVYDTSDLINWVLVGAVTLDDGGMGSFTNTTGVPYRFYKVYNGQTVSQVIGFVQVTAYPGDTIVANQLVAPNYTLNGLFPGGALADGTTMPVGTGIGFYNGSSVVFDTLTSGHTWSLGGTEAMSLGVGAFITNTTASPFTVTFVGTVAEGTTSVTTTSGNNLIGCPLPQAGLITSNLGYPASPSDDLETLDPVAQSYNISQYRLVPFVGWHSTELPVAVGQGFWMITSSVEVWSRTFSVSP